MKLNYIETNSTDPFYNLAFEEFLFKNRKEGDWFMLWQNTSTVVVGANQNTEEEVNRDFVREHGINVVRRITGGGAVYHDLGNLNYSFITDVGEPGQMSISHFSRPICRALESLGVYAYTSGKNDILVAGRKISGVAQSVYGGRILHHGCLLINSDVDMISGALNVEPEKFSSKSTKSISSRVGTLSQYIEGDASVQRVKNAIIEQICSESGESVTLSTQELEQVEILAESKYRSWEWNYGSSPDYNYKNKARFPGGTLCLMLDIQAGRIVSAAISGDFMATQDCAPLTQALVGLRFDRQEIAHTIAGLQLSPFIGQITAEEFLSLL